MFFILFYFIFNSHTFALDSEMIRVLITACRTAFKNPPFRIAEQGWGEFDMQIVFTAADKDHAVTHDLNFAQTRYESKHLIVRSTPHGEGEKGQRN